MTKRTFLKRACAPILALAMALIAAPAWASPPVAYECMASAHPDLAQEGMMLGENIYDYGDMMALTAYPEEGEKLPRVVGEQFSNGKITFKKNGKTGRLIMSDGTTFPCVYAIKEIIAQAATLGTIIRDGPDVNATKLHDFPRGELVSIIGQSGVFYQDYQWFQIQFWEGQEGYAWGGTLCADTELAGIVLPCPEGVKTSY